MKGLKEKANKIDLHKKVDKASFESLSKQHLDLTVSYNVEIERKRESVRKQLASAAFVQSSLIAKYMRALYAHAIKRIYTDRSTHAHSHTHVHIRIHPCVHMYIHIDTHICTLYIYTHVE